MTEIASGCKINLNLIVGEKDLDGRHFLESIVVPLASPSDLIRIRPASSGGFRLRCDKPLDGENILIRAYEGFAKASGVRPDLQVELVKNIPVGAGLGGGSGDAASFIKWLNNSSGRPLDELAMRDLAFSLGSDVPLFLRSTPCRVMGKGETTEPVQLKWPRFHVVLVWPDARISTNWAYEALDAAREREKNLTNDDANNKNLALSREETIEFRDPFFYRNDLEAPVFDAYPRLADLKENFYVLGAFYAAMSGSGSAIYGLFTDDQTAKTARETLSRRYSHVYLTSHAGM